MSIRENKFAIQIIKNKIQNVFLLRPIIRTFSINELLIELNNSGISEYSETQIKDYIKSLPFFAPAGAVTADENLALGIGRSHIKFIVLPNSIYRRYQDEFQQWITTIMPQLTKIGGEDVILDGIKYKGITPEEHERIKDLVQAANEGDDILVENINGESFVLPKNVIKDIIH